MQIAFDIPHSFHPTASQADDAEVLNVLLESLIAINRIYLRNHSAKSLYRSGVVYGRTIEWDSIPALYARGFGDCKSLSAARIAELRERDEAARPFFRFRIRKDGHRDFHILVCREGTGDSIWEDPSKVCGMGQSENAYFRR